VVECPAMDKGTKSLGTKPIGRLLWQFSLPAVFAMLIETIYSTTDRLFVAHMVGADGIAAIGVAMPVITLMVAIQLLLNVGGGSIFSIMLGEKDKKGAQAVLSNTLLLQIILGALFMVGGWIYLEKILVSNGASSATLPLAKTYLGAVLCAGAFDIIGYGLNGFIFRLGFPNRSTFNIAVGAGLNIFLDWLFMARLGWGMFGAGLATAISITVATALVLSFFLSPKCPIKLAIPRPDIKLMTLIGKFGASPFLLHLTFVLNGWVTNNMLVEHGGDWALAAHGISNTIMMFCMMPVFGITSAMQSIAGYNFGAKKWERLKKTTELTFATLIAWMAVFITAALLWREGLVALFDGGKSGAQALEFAVWQISVNAPILPFLSVVFVANSYLLSTGHYIKALVLNMVRQLVFMIPFMMILPRFFGIKGTTYAFVSGDTCAIILSGAFLIYEWRKLNKKIASARKQPYT